MCCLLSAITDICVICQPTICCLIQVNVCITLYEMGVLQVFPSHIKRDVEWKWRNMFKQPQLRISFPKVLERDWIVIVRPKTHDHTLITIHLIITFLRSSIAEAANVIPRDKFYTHLQFVIHFTQDIHIPTADWYPYLINICS